MKISVKTKLEVIQKALTNLGVESGPANLARIFGVAQSSIFRWLNDEAQPRGKQAERIDLLYRTAREAEAGTKRAEQAKEILKKLVSPVAAAGGSAAGAVAGAGLMGATSLISFGLLGAVFAAGLGWLLSDKEDADTDEE